jgi:hypothetical protein
MVFPCRWILRHDRVNALLSMTCPTPSTQVTMMIYCVSAPAMLNYWLSYIFLLCVGESSNAWDPTDAKNAIGNMLERDMRKWINKRKMNYLKSVVKPISKGKLCHQQLIHESRWIVCPHALSYKAHPLLEVHIKII